MHITSLPSQYGVGDLGDEAYRFVDSISDNGISLWQILPTGPTGFGDSPYAARSAFAGNELFISPKALYLEGWLEVELHQPSEVRERREDRPLIPIYP